MYEEIVLFSYSFLVNFLYFSISRELLFCPVQHNDILSYYPIIPYSFMSCRILSYYTWSYPIIFRSYRVISYLTLSNPTISSITLYPIITYLTWPYPIISYPIPNYLIRAAPIISYLIISDHIISAYILNYSILNYPILFHQILSDPIWSYPIINYPARSCLVISDPISGKRAQRIEKSRRFKVVKARVSKRKKWWRTKLFWKTRH